MLISWILGRPLTRHTRYTGVRGEFCNLLFVRLLYLLDEGFISECKSRELKHCKANSWRTFQRDFGLWDPGKTERQLVCSTAQQNKRTSAMVHGNKRHSGEKIRRISKTWGRKPRDIFMIPPKPFPLTEVPLPFFLKYISFLLASKTRWWCVFSTQQSTTAINHTYIPRAFVVPKKARACVGWPRSSSHRTGTLARPIRGGRPHSASETFNAQ